MGQVPELVTGTFRNAGTLQLGSHGAVHEQNTAGVQSFEEARHDDLAFVGISFPLPSVYLCLSFVV